jgi:diguanylate cyclase
MITLDEFEAAAVAASIVGCAWALHATALRRRTRTCPATSLLTRTPFETKGRRLIRRRDAVVLFADLDQFKLVNDTLGHDAGDELLAVTGQRLRARFGPAAVVAHLHGDEFAAVLRLGPVDGPWTTDLEQLAALLAEPVVLADGRTARVGVSIGAVHLAGVRATLSSVLRDADRLLYEAKASARPVCTGRATGQPVLDRRPKSRIRDMRVRPAVVGQQPC